MDKRVRWDGSRTTFPMSEYSRAPGRGHRLSARERAMQVERQPSPWPCVAMLAGLLLLCLMAPRYWQNTVVVDDPAIGAETSVTFSDFDRPQDRVELGNAHGQFDFTGIGIGGFAVGTNNDLLNLCAPPPIEELIATHSAMTELSSHFGRPSGDGFDWPLLVRTAMEAGQGAPPAAELVDPSLAL